ncbi:short-chain dehydrogenase [Seohaeicola zhoushanensis]|uniref:Short-chain dehydrogenase n=2 Tax=Seohaeicola zhoushanensis TaxID=1569283 RepID=A0A8J3GWV9_9RHOB|nr:short-chain dehydrogenase [Seohaeicola zhoushanensis]
MTKLVGKVMWVVGASGAIGEGIARQLLDQGATVVASSRSIETKGPAIEGADLLNVDVSSMEAAIAAADEIVRRHGRLDGLVVTTTLPIFGDFLDLTDEDWGAVLGTKLMGSVRLTRAVVPHMAQSGGGSVVLLSGGGGKNPSLRHLPGSVANAGVNLLAQGLAKRFGPDKIRVNVVAPGPIESPRLEAIKKAKGPSVFTALGGAGQVEDVSEAVAFLLSEKAKYISGANISVDGGGRLADPA